MGDKNLISLNCIVWKHIIFQYLKHITFIKSLNFTLKHINIINKKNLKLL